MNFSLSRTSCLRHGSDKKTLWNKARAHDVLLEAIILILETCLEVYEHQNGINQRSSSSEETKNWIKSARRLYLMRQRAGSAFKVIGTHNGTFHCDEALAVYLLRLTEAYRDAGYSVFPHNPHPIASC